MIDLEIRDEDPGSKDDKIGTYVTVSWTYLVLFPSNYYTDHEHFALIFLLLKGLLFYRAAIDISSSASNGTLDTVRNIS